MTKGSPSDAEYDRIAKSVTKDMQSYQSKDVAKLFGTDYKNQMHNEIAVAVKNGLLNRRNKKGEPYNAGNLDRSPLIKHYDKLIPSIQQKLIADKKVIHYTYNGKEIYRNNAPWSKEEIARLNELYGQHSQDKQVAGALGRSVESVVRKRQKLGIKENVRTMEGFRSMFGE